MSSANNNATYWLIAVPKNAGSFTTAAAGDSGEKAQLFAADEAKATLTTLRQKTAKYSTNVELNVPTLRVGTLDALMQLSDELGKIDTQIEGVVKKIQRTYLDLKAAGDVLMVEGKTPAEYIEMFRWNQAKYPINANLKELTARIHADVSTTDDEMRTRLAKYTDVVQAVAAIERKQSGSLLVKSLADYVKPTDLIDREYITTCLVVVPRAKEEEFLERYASMDAEDAEKKVERRGGDDDDDDDDNDGDGAAGNRGNTGGDGAQQDDGTSSSVLDEDMMVRSGMSSEEIAAHRERVAKERRLAEEREQRRLQRQNMCSNVVPGSAKKLAEEEDYALYRVLVMRKGVDTFRLQCRERRWTVRAYVHDPQGSEDDKQRKVELTAKRNRLLATNIQWCETNYSEVFTAWIHIKIIRTFVESVLRFGIPVNFLAVLVKPHKGYRTKLRKTLEELYSHLGGDLAGQIDSDVDITGFGQEFYPYVYLTIDLEL